MALDGPHRKSLLEEFKCLEENFATFAFAAFVAGAEFSGVKSSMTNFRKRIPRIMKEMQECVKLIQHRLPRASETQALIGSEPVEDKGLQRKHAALCAHVENFSAVQMVTQSRMWLGDLVSTSTIPNIHLTLISITLTLEIRSPPSSPSECAIFSTTTIILWSGQRVRIPCQTFSLLSNVSTRIQCHATFRCS